MSWQGLAATLALAIAVSTTACVTPPVIFAATSDSWTLEKSNYPADAILVEVVRSDAPTLRGIRMPSDHGAPLVVHFAESGGSISSSAHTRAQYEELAELGFASLALDYRGVGLSGGSTSPRRLADDARSMYAQALELVDGDETRLILRGTSIGALAVASVLQEGARPGAVVLFAPVLAESVAIRYGYATLWDPLVWLARPFLRSFLSASLVDELARCPSPLLVFASRADELLSDAEFEALRGAVLANGGTFVEPKIQIRFHIEGVPETYQLEEHIAIASTSYHVRDTEEQLLRQVYPDAPDLATRRARVLAAGAPELVALLDDAAAARLDALLSRTRNQDANALLAAAIRIESPAQALDLLNVSTSKHLVAKNVLRDRSPAELLALLDHSDPAGPLPVHATEMAQRMLQGVWSGRATTWLEDWPLERVLALAHALDGEADGLHVMRPADAPEKPPLGVSFLLEDDGLVTARIALEDGTYRLALHRTLLDSALAADEALAPELRARRRLRVLLKATGHIEHAVADSTGEVLVEVRDESGTTRLLHATAE